MINPEQDHLQEIGFIIGMGRSGTTLLTNMLNSNPNIVSTPENEFIIFAYKSYINKDFNNNRVTGSFIKLFQYNYSKVLSIWKPSSELYADINSLKKKTFANICKLVYLNYPFAEKKKSEIQFIVDKNPVYSLYLKKLNEVYPASKYIVLIRDPRDNVLSRKKYADSKSSVFELAVSWNYYYKKIFDDIKKYRLDYRLVRYEDLVANPSDLLKQLCEFLGITYSDRMLEFQDLSKKMKAHVRENAPFQVYDKISQMHSNLDENVNMKRVNAYENELSRDDIAVINYICEDFAKMFGYMDQAESEKLIVKSTWSLLHFYYKIRVSLYYSIKEAYFKLPVHFRLFFLKRTDKFF